MELVKEIAMHFGFVCAGTYLLFGLYYLAGWIKKKLELRISDKVAEELKGLLPKVNRKNDGCLLMVVDGRWQSVRIDNEITMIGVEQYEEE
jgi:hypothetical protein